MRTPLDRSYRTVMFTALAIAPLTHSSAPAEADEQSRFTAQIAILHCRPYPKRGAFQIEYVNRSNRVIDSVSFQISGPRGVDRVTDRGEFSPGITIDHLFAEVRQGGSGFGNSQSCAVEAVHYREEKGASS